MTAIMPAFMARASAGRPQQNCSQSGNSQVSIVPLPDVRIG